MQSMRKIRRGDETNTFNKIALQEVIFDTNKSGPYEKEIDVIS